jgi:hypothetical protein
MKSCSMGPGASQKSTEYYSETGSIENVLYLQSPVCVFLLYPFFARLMLGQVIVLFSNCEDGHRISPARHINTTDALL